MIWDEFFKTPGASGIWIVAKLWEFRIWIMAYKLKFHG
jgi:hypothetical protein